MTDKEKLVELLSVDSCPGDGIEDCYECNYVDETDCYLARTADHLIANGVTIQKWISVEERLPELIPCNAGTAYSEAVIVWTDNRKAMVAVWDGVDFLCAADYWEAWGENITHWMPLPPAPKGE